MQKVVPIGFRTDCCTMSRCLLLYRTMQVLHRVCSHACLTIFRHRVYSPSASGLFAYVTYFDIGFIPNRNRLCSHAHFGIGFIPTRHRVCSHARIGTGFIPVLTYVYPESESGLFPCSLGQRVYSYAASGLFPCFHRCRIHSRWASGFICMSTRSCFGFAARELLLIV